MFKVTFSYLASLRLGWDIGVSLTYKQMKEQMNKASF